MISFSLIVLLFGACAAQKFSATQSGNDIVILRSENEINGQGNFRWLSELSDGTKLEQNGYVKDGPDPENPIQVIEGSFSYIAPDGTPISLQYVADERGFVPVGDHIPTPSPAVQQGIDLILRNIDNQGQGEARPLVSQPQRPASQSQRPAPQSQRPASQPQRPTPQRQQQQQQPQQPRRG